MDVKTKASMVMVVVVVVHMHEQGDDLRVTHRIFTNTFAKTMFGKRWWWQ